MSVWTLFALALILVNCSLLYFNIRHKQMLDRHAIEIEALMQQAFAWRRITACLCGHAWQLRQRPEIAKLYIKTFMVEDEDK